MRKLPPCKLLAPSHQYTCVALHLPELWTQSAGKDSPIAGLPAEETVVCMSARHS